MAIAASGSGGGISGVIKQFEKLQAAANKANEQRYKELLSEIRKIGEQTGRTYDEAGNLISNIGRTARARVDQNETRQQARGEQDLISRGLGNTTIRESVRRGIADDAELQRQSIDEQVALQQSGLLQSRAGADLQVGGMLTNAIQGRNDVGPDMSMYANLIRQLQASQQASKPANVAVGRGLPPTTGTGFTSSRSGGGMGGGGGAPAPASGSSGGSGARGAWVMRGGDPHPRVIRGGDHDPAERERALQNQLVGGVPERQFFRDLTAFKFR